MRDFRDEINRVTNMLLNDGYFWIRTMWGAKWYSSPDGKIELVVDDCGTLSLQCGRNYFDVISMHLEDVKSIDQALSVLQRMKNSTTL